MTIRALSKNLNHLLPYPDNLQSAMLTKLFADAITLKFNHAGATALRQLSIGDYLSDIAYVAEMGRQTYYAEGMTLKDQDMGFHVFVENARDLISYYASDDSTLADAVEYQQTLIDMEFSYLNNHGRGKKVEMVKADLRLQLVNYLDHLIALDRLEEIALNYDICLENAKLLRFSKHELEELKNKYAIYLIKDI